MAPTKGAMSFGFVTDIGRSSDLDLQAILRPPLLGGILVSDRSHLGSLSGDHNPLVGDLVCARAGECVCVCVYIYIYT